MSGTTTYWIRKIERHAGPNILFWVERVMRDDPVKFPPREVRTDFNVFADLMQAAIDTTREYETMHKRPPAALYTLLQPISGGGRGGGNEAERAQDPCPECKGRLCPKGKAAANVCDVYGTVSQSARQGDSANPILQGVCGPHQSLAEQTSSELPPADGRREGQAGGVRREESEWKGLQRRQGRTWPRWTRSRQSKRASAAEERLTKRKR